MTTKLALTYDEQQAIAVIRKAMKTKPEIITYLMDGQSYAMAAKVLLKAQDELAQLLEVNRAFIAASLALVKQDKE